MKEAEKKDDLFRVAGQVADQTPVDWVSEDRQAEERMRGKLRQLRLVEKIGELHRSLQEKKDEGAAPSSWGPLQIRERLGMGGFGEVFRAHDPALNRDVALKLLHQQRETIDGFEERFLAEARQLARVRHPNVLVVHGVDRHGDRAGIWTDLLEGKTLEQCLREQGPFGADEATLIGIDLCRALAAVHAAGLVHRDVKTSNVMREEGGRIVLLDFSSVTDRDQTGRTVLQGTPFYMAPELFEGRDSGIAADIYSLGVLLYRLVSGRFPVRADGLSELEEAHRQGASVPLRDARPDLPTAFVLIVERALSADPGDRYASVGQMEQDLAAAMGSASGAARVATARPRPRRFAVVSLLAAAALIVAVVAGALMVGSSRAPLAVEAQFVLPLDGGDYRRLVPGARVRPGERLGLEISGSRPMHVYVINYDERGEGYTLFPLPGSNLANPLPPRVRHRLPGVVNGEQKFWEVSSAAGREFMLVVASREPVSLVEAEIARLPAAGSGVPTISGEAIVKLRGIGGLTSGPAGAGRADDRLSGLSDRLAAPSTASDGVWVLEMELFSEEAEPGEPGP